MLTKKDIQTLKDTFATKEDLNSVKEDLNSLREDFRELRNDVLTFKDELMFQILAMRDELSVVIGYRNHIEDHEIRIEKLEDEILTNKSA